MSPLARSPLAFSINYTSDMLANLDGGLARGFRYLEKTSLAATYDGAAEGHGGFMATASINHTNASNFSAELVGDIHGVSNIEAPEATRINELWVSRRAPNDLWGVKIGIVDLNTEFDVLESGSLFLNSAHGIETEFSHTGVNGPSIFPATTLAITSFYRPTDRWTVRLGVFDGTAGDPANPRRFAVELSAKDGALIVAQVERNVSDVDRIEAGVWGYTASFDALDQFDAEGARRRVSGNLGAYAMVEGQLLGKSGGDRPRLNGWLRFGVSNGAINKIDSYIGGGIVWTGLTPNRPKDQLGLALAYGGISGSARADARRRGAALGAAETNIELTYQLAFRVWFLVQPDLQYVIAPGGNSLTPTALVVGVRVQLAASR